MRYIYSHRWRNCSKWICNFERMKRCLCSLYLLYRISLLLNACLGMSNFLLFFRIQLLGFGVGYCAYIKNVYCMEDDSYIHLFHICHWWQILWLTLRVKFKNDVVNLWDMCIVDHMPSSCLLKKVVFSSYLDWFSL